MSSTTGYVFLAIYALGAIWLITSGILSFRTKQCTIWVGSKVYSWSGRKALVGGALTILIGLCLLALAIVQFRAIYSHSALG